MTKKRARTEQRVDARAARKLVQAREKLAALEAGGAAERPMVVPSSSVIAVRARAQPCPQCQGTLVLEEETAERHGERLLRAAHLRCQRCGVARVMWFAISSPLPS